MRTAPMTAIAVTSRIHKGLNLVIARLSYNFARRIPYLRPLHLAARHRTAYPQLNKFAFAWRHFFCVNICSVDAIPSTNQKNTDRYRCLTFRLGHSVSAGEAGVLMVTLEPQRSRLYPQ